jgi:hypothetical protein
MRSVQPVDLPTLRAVSTRFHVTSVLNRASILEHGLDWTYMGAAPGIAGSDRPEAEGVFLAEEWDVDWFVRMNNTGGPVDVWSVVDVEEDLLVGNGSGYFFLPDRIAPARLGLLHRDLPPLQD